MPQDVLLSFSRDEYADRIERVRVSMEEAGIDVMIATDPSNMAWLTGYDGWSFYVHQAVIVFASGNPIWWGRNMDAAGAMRTVWMDEDRIVGYPDNLVQSPDRHPMQHLAELLIDHGFGKSTIGVEMENYYFSAAAHAALRATMEGARLYDATNLVNWCRILKSDTEIGFIRRAARISDRLHAHVLDMIEPGVRKCDLVAEIYNTAIRGAEDEDGPYGGDYPAIVPMLPTGVDASAPHLTWDDRQLRGGEGTFFELSGCYRRYHAPLSRTVYLGTPPDIWYRAEEAVLAGIEAALDQSRPGNTCHDVWYAFTKALNAHGFTKESRMGYSIGLSYPPDWGERTMSFRKDDMTVLQAGMTYHLMPAIWLDDWGLEISETVLVTDTGSQTLCETPRKLFVKP
ncbi:MAG: M24 family metallopeptidase [Alphaproteobacteria bacterium]|mgnify:CR=1 FL=1|nr:M24 family metallopeptidase [Alphaproteobacteria bacterium]MDX5368335.1 M24 family metallopeptidase [Alphaproteobacteria bacterium]MDX5463130.1 M24 family metallopeptidase [Alphaproteobacteria bacterium]